MFPYWTIALAAISYLAWRRLTKSQGVLPYPPGPSGLPLIGNLLDAPKEREWITYHKWAQTHGDIVSYGAFGLQIIIVNSAKVAADLFERRSTLYSDRREGVMLNELMGFEWTFAVNAYGDKWRKRRRVFRSHLHQGVSHVYEGIQILEARRFLQQLLHKPNDLHELSRGFIGATVMNIAYGVEVTGPQDPYITIADEVVREFSSAMFPGSFLIDYIPALRYVPSWFPGAGFKRYAERARLRTIEMRAKPLSVVKQGMADGTCKPCLVSRMLSNMPEHSNSQEVEQLISDSAGNMYQAGSDTTVSSVMTFFLAMVLFPGVQERAQAELDTVVGTDRLPDFSDRNQLPYIAALIKEVWRWQPVAPLALPHAVVCDDVYNGYLIPKGSAVIGNVWAMSRDPADYPEPDEFCPERFLTTVDGKLVPNKAVRDPFSFAFGFGRRICPGRHLAEQSLYAVVILALSTLRIKPVVDENGAPTPPRVEMDTGLVSHPKPFKYKIEPRSQRAIELIQGPLPDRGL